MRDGAFDAAFVAVGAHLARRAYVPAGATARVLDAIALLHEMEDGAAPLLGRRVAVVGGGNTALDVARTARRLGAEEAVVVYRRTRADMPAHPSEVEEALDEDVRMRWLSVVDHVEPGRIVVERVRQHDDGSLEPTGEVEELAADCLVLATGQECDLSLLAAVDGVQIDDGVVQVGPDLMTGHPGVFCGGDAVPAERTVTTAIGHGATAAAHVDAWLRGERATVGDPRAPATFDLLNTWYFGDAPHAVRPQLEHARRISSFDEVVGGLEADTALFEARRCLSCGSCLTCDNCFGMCPDNAVIKLEPAAPYAYAIDLDYCKGCGICARECPAGAIAMEPEIV